MFGKFFSGLRSRSEGGSIWGNIVLDHGLNGPSDRTLICSSA